MLSRGGPQGAFTHCEDESNRGKIIIILTEVSWTSYNDSKRIGDVLHGK